MKLFGTSLVLPENTLIILFRKEISHFKKTDYKAKQPIEHPMIEKILSAIGGSVFGFLARGALERRRRLHVFRRKIDGMIAAIRNTHECNDPKIRAHKSWPSFSNDIIEARRDIEKNKEDKFDAHIKSVLEILRIAGGHKKLQNENGSWSPSYEHQIGPLVEHLEALKKLT